MVRLHLYHGRHDPDMEMDNWGEDGPQLAGEWLKVTYMGEVTLGDISPETLALVRDHDPDMLYHDGANGWCIDMRVEGGCLRFGSVFYGDWDVESV